MTNIGLTRGTVQLVPYEENWKAYFDEEAKLIKQKLGESVDVQHVGSTAIPGILAKPIIDIAIPYSSYETAKTWIKLLEELGYEYKGDKGVIGRLFFTKGPETKRTVYLHVVDSDEFNRLISFRDRLIKDKELAKQYSDLKQRLAGEHADDRSMYTHGKEQFIQSVFKIGLN